MDYTTLSLLLAVLGFALILAEIFIPSGGLISVGCIISFSASIWFAYKAWWLTYPNLFLGFIVLLLVGIPIFLLALLRLLETTRLGDRFLLTAPKADELVPYKDEEQKLAALVGQHGRSLSMLGPGGMVSVGGQRLHAIAENLLIDPGEWIEVVGVRDGQLVVRKATAPVQNTEEFNNEQPGVVNRPVVTTKPSTPADSTQLDFELPQS